MSDLKLPASYWNDCCDSPAEHKMHIEIYSLREENMRLKDDKILGVREERDFLRAQLARAEGILRSIGSGNFTDRHREVVIHSYFRDKGEVVV